MRWIFDGTLAKSDGYQGPFVLGEPIEDAISLVKKWLDNGDQVSIFTARLNCDDPMEKMQIICAIQAWCKKHIGQVLEITCEKKLCFTDFVDDRNICIEKNTGKILYNPYSSASTTPVNLKK